MEGKPGDLEGLAATTTKAIERESAPATSSTNTAPEVKMSTPPVPAASEEYPDPDEDDLDDLDDMLDEFIPSKPAELKAPTTYHPSAPPANTTIPPPLPGLEALSEGLSDDDFAAQLQAGMAELMGELDNSPDMQAQFENMLKELGGAAALGEATGAPASTSAPKDKNSKKSKTAAASNATDASFQDTIAATMERMRTSGDQATAAAASENTDDLLAEMMKAMQSGGLEGEGGEEEFSKMLMGMMEQLTNKEILYEPMKELDDKFPTWMEANAGKVEEADMKRYKEQQTYVKEIVGRFERKGYTDDNAADREYIVERMQKMQAAGSPPADLVGDMAAAQEAFGAPEEGCATQ